MKTETTALHGGFAGDANGATAVPICQTVSYAYKTARELADVFDGQLMTVLPGETTCYRCIFGAPPPPGAVPSCSQAGVLGLLGGVIGALQATEAIKYLLALGDLLTDALLTYNALTMAFRKIELRRNPQCPLCGERPEILELRDEEQAVCDVKGCQC